LCSCVLDKKIKNENILFFIFEKTKKINYFIFLDFFLAETAFFTRKKRVFC